MSATVTPLPTPVPSTSNPADFDDNGDAFLGALPTFATELTALAAEVEANTTSAEAAAASAASTSTAYGTSTTSLSVSVGSKSLTIAEASRTFQGGQYVVIARTSAAATTFMLGRITAFNSGTGAMTVSVDSVTGSGTYTNWTVSLAAPNYLPAAVAANVRAGTSASVAVTPEALTSAAAWITLTDGATINWDVSTGYNARVTLGGNRTMAAPTNLQDGVSYGLAIIQDATGSRTVSWNSTFDWGQSGAPTLSTAAGSVDHAFGIYSSTTGKLHMNFRKAA